ncbi:MAG: nucleoside-triphosphatase [Myxococcales bacterium]|jgi:hypothetical protein
MTPPPTSREADLFWAQVTAFGALWGTIEITLGSFLHSLRLPFSGTLLAALGAVLLIAQRQLFPARGVTLATGIVAALCKSVSPGGVILGPMVGIATEAVLVELALLVAPRALGSGMAAGALCVGFAAFQKLVTQYVFYGGTVLELYLAALRKAGHLLGIERQAWWVLAAALAVLAAMGAAAGALGRSLGQKSRARLAEAPAGATLRPEPASARSGAEARNDFAGTGRAERTDRTPEAAGKARRIGLSLASAGCIGLQLGGSLGWSAASLGIWLGLLWAFSPRSLRRLWMPKFWGFSLALALASGVLLGKSDVRVLGVPVSLAGLEAGLLMVVRGAFVFGLTSWASTTLRRDHLERVFEKVGLTRLGRALTAAFALLPGLKDRLAYARAQLPGRGEGRRLARVFDLAVEVVGESARLAGEIAGNRARPPVLAVVGAPGAGKTTTVLRAARQLADQGLAVAGIVQLARREAGRALDYRLQEVSSGEERPFASRAPEGHGFVFDAAGWSWARERIDRARAGADVVIVDELGRLEGRGEGHLPALLAPSEAERARLWIVAVREDAADEIERRLGDFDARVRADDGDGAVADAVAQASRLIAERRGGEEALGALG